MKRLRDWLYPPPVVTRLTGDVPCDVWSYIINLYYHLKFDEEWRRFKESARSCNIFILPVERIEIPLFYFDPNIRISVCYEIHRLHWDRGSIMGAQVSTYKFCVGAPDVRLDNHGPVVLLDHDILRNDSDVEKIRGLLVSPIHRIERSGVQLGTLTITWDVLPYYARGIL